MLINVKGSTMSSEMATPRVENDIGWCNVRHHSTENLIIGRSIPPTIAKMAAYRPPLSRSSTSFLSIRYPPRIKRSTLKETNRGSQVHQAPQVGLAQMDPVTRARAVNRAQIPADAWHMLSTSGSRFHKYQILPKNKTEYARVLVCARGTWTYMIRTSSPW